MKRILSLTLCIVFLLCMFAPLSYATSSNTKEKIRVGWFESEYFLTDKNGRKSGYAYDYLQRIAAYTGWEYEYVEGGWYELFVMLQNGEIDIMSDVTYTEERQDTMLFTHNPMGAEGSYIFIDKDNKELSASDYSTFNGKKIAVMKDSYQEELLLKWVASTGITPTIVYETVSEDKQAQKLLNGECDAIVGATDFEKWNSDIKPLLEIESSNVYFAVKKDRTDIVAKLDSAMNSIFSNDRNYNNTLFAKYFEDTGIINGFTSEETNWLKEHKTITIGYRDNYLPFCDYDEIEGDTGFLKELIDYYKNSGLLDSVSFKLVGYASSEDALLAMKNGEVDCVFPMAQAAYDAETNDFSITAPLVSSDMYIIIRDSDENVDTNSNLRVAINEGNTDYETTVDQLFPNWEKVYFKTSEDGLKGISNNEADCLLVSSYRLNALSNLMEKYKLTAISTNKQMDVGFAVSKENVVLYSIMDKLTSSVSNDTASLMLSNNSIEARKTTVLGFIKDNIIISSLFILLVFGLIILAILQRIFHRKEEIINESLRLANEDLINANEAAEKASQAKTEFLFNMSHDIRTPMNAILGFNNMAIRDIDNKEKTLESLHKSQVSGQALLSIINDILDTSRLESGKVSISTIKGNVEKCFVESEVVLRGLAKNNNVNINFIVYEMEHKYAYIDVTHIDRILFNIISNAIKYTPAGGTVTVEAKEIPSNKDGYGRYQFTVTDTGIGMSKEFQKEMFKPFTREENSTTSGIVGTGLGLSLVKSFVDLLEGEISCKSELGKGTTMTVELEMKLQEKEEIDLPEIEETNDSGETNTGEANLKDKTILLVEDNELNREIAMDILFEYEANVICAENGQIALDKLEQNGIDKFDFILMDIQMPIMDGYEATKEIRRKYPDIHIPIIAVSANAFEQDKQKSFSIGMDAHIAKPIDVDELMRTISEVVK